MRYIMKGGVWKNSEDQILKAAIMKYGLNQWSRISSLLQRKSAKQCKQRWYEWLDPSIKKTEWSRSEDQKLLQLARVFPSQWRTIAPFVGRTPTQCFQRYQKLLDLAQGKTAEEIDDLRKLRPGEIDPNPETKPARLDPIDMDEDEKEMLAEVRVRLPNTKGKKAKRKERQKIIEEARRLAQLQKLRELEMAGVDNIPTQKQLKRLRQKQDIDYNKQIPFKREVPEFVYKVQESEGATKNNFFASTISLQTLEGKRRDVQEELQRKLDKKRLKKLKDRDYKSMLQLNNRFDKPVSMPISLPEPQINEKDLEDMKKYNITTPLNSMMHNATPMIMTPENKVMFAAKVNFSLNHRDIVTPIAEQEDQNQVMDGVQGLNYLKQVEKKQKDPNRLRSVDRIISERMKTPNTNEWEHENNKIKSLFRGLSKAENVIELEIPEEDEEEEQDQQQIQDAEELERREQLLSKINQEARLQNRNKVLKLNLPRVLNIPTTLTPSKTNLQAQRLIEQQIISLLYSDAIDYPPSTFSLADNFEYTYSTPFSKQKILVAEQLINIELQNMKVEANYQQCQNIYQQGKQRVNIDHKQKIATIRENPLSSQQTSLIEYKNTMLHLSYYVKILISKKQLDKSNESAEKKLKVYHKGFEKKIKQNIQEINSLEEELEKLEMERKALECLAVQEEKSAKLRIQEEESFYRLIYNAI